MTSFDMIKREVASSLTAEQREYLLVALLKQYPTELRLNLYANTKARKPAQ